MPSTTQARRREILESLRHLPLHVRTLPGMADLASGRVGLNDVRELDIEDLLGREPVAPDLALLNKLIQDRVVAVTGAGGSIGSELCRQIVQHGPRTLLLIEQSEYGLYATHQELSRKVGADMELVPLLAQVMLSRTRDSWLQALEAVGIPAGPINTMEQVYQDPQVLARGLRLDLPTGQGGRLPSVASPLRLSATPVQYRSAPPRLGEHTREVLARVLELSSDEVEALVSGSAA